MGFEKLVDSRRCDIAKKLMVVCLSPEVYEHYGIQYPDLKRSGIIDLVMYIHCVVREADSSYWFDKLRGKKRPVVLKACELFVSEAGLSLKEGELDDLVELVYRQELEAGHLNKKYRGIKIMWSKSRKYRNMVKKLLALSRLQ